MKFYLTVYVKDLIMWAAIVSLAIGLSVEHSVARDYENATRRGIEQILSRIMPSQ